LFLFNESCPGFHYEASPPKILASFNSISISPLFFFFLRAFRIQSGLSLLLAESTTFTYSYPLLNKSSSSLLTCLPRPSPFNRRIRSCVSGPTFAFPSLLSSLGKSSKSTYIAMSPRSPFLIRLYNFSSDSSSL